MSLLLPASVKLDYGLVKFSPTERTKVMMTIPRCHDTFLKPPALTDSPHRPGNAGQGILGAGGCCGRLCPPIPRFFNIQ